MERRQNINIPVRTPLVSLTRSMGTTGIYHLGSILSPASNRSSNRRSSCRGSTGLNRAEEGAKSEAPGWELRELREREEEREVEAEELGAAGEPDAKQAPLFLPTLSWEEAKSLRSLATWRLGPGLCLRPKGGRSVLLSSLR